MKTISCFLILFMLVTTGFAGPAAEEKEKKEDKEIRPALVVIDIQKVGIDFFNAIINPNSKQINCMRRKLKLCVTSSVR